MILMKTSISVFSLFITYIHITPFIKLYITELGKIVDSLVEGRYEECKPVLDNIEPSTSYSGWPVA